jgi:hypothetical protein
MVMVVVMVMVMVIVCGGLSWWFGIRNRSLASARFVGIGGGSWGGGY